MIKDIKIRKIKQIFCQDSIPDIPEYIHQAFNSSDLLSRIKPGDKIGITVGSRGISNINSIVKQIVIELKNIQAKPLILSAMGSHGGANSEGQRKVLASYGITEKEMGVPILSSMETIQIGKVENNIPIYFSKDAMQIDGIISLNRVKSHTDFKSNIVESGMSKMLVIGLGKEKGARTIHSLGIYGLKSIIQKAAKLILSKAPIIQGIGILENGYNQTMKISFVPPGNIICSDSELLKVYKEVIPMLPIEELDVVITQEIGKNISGTGFDTNVIGRLYINGEKEIIKPRIKGLVVFDITEESNGNAIGIGLADITTRHLADKINYKDMYANTITSTFLNRAKIPIIANTEREAVEIAVKTCWKLEQSNLKLLIMKNTSNLEYLYVSKEVWEKIKKNKNIEAYGYWEELTFDKNGLMEQRI